MHGACLCGVVQFEAEPSDLHSHACHCTMCRRWTGSALVAVPVPREALRWQGEERIRTFRSSEWAERGWCDACGSTLFYRVTEGEQEGVHYLAIGLFDEPDALPLASEIYIDRKPSAYAFAGERKRMTKAEVEAQFGGGGS